ncbi:MAG TPA: phosphate acyltransferase PlsX [Thermoanaerobaculia bacterium]|nr:phosphate acyltransferase PlsX [Thermoanaerobaculia bacterium]
MLSHVTIAVDAMGGDHAPASVVEGVLLALREPSWTAILVGDEPSIRRELERLPAPDGRLEIVHAEEVVGMDESPITPIRKKRRSSIRLCADLVREGRAHGMVSAGNTGAVMIAAKMVIGTIEGVDRPALAAVMPSQSGFTLVLDVGANVDTKVEHLRQFAVMGHFYAQEILHTPAPRIGLLSIGEEEGKGTDFTRQVFKIMESLRLNFVGNVEGRDVFRGSVDVIVCDGFVGNVMLKASEALGEMISAMLRHEMSRSWRTRAGYLFARPAFQGLLDRLDYSEYGAAPLLGVKGGCFIGHGVSSAKAVKNAVLRAREFCEAELHQKMREKIAEMHAFERSLENARPREVV